MIPLRRKEDRDDLIRLLDDFQGKRPKNVALPITATIAIITILFWIWSAP